jgi:hypothetical protein
MVLFMDWSFASGCSPLRLSTTQLPSATDSPVLLSDGDLHPTIGAYSQAHVLNRFAASAPLVKTGLNPAAAGLRLCSPIGTAISAWRNTDFPMEDSREMTRASVTSIESYLDDAPVSFPQ